EDQAVHPTTQRKGRALPANPGRGTALRPRVQQRRCPLHCDRCLEHPLQLPSTAQRRRRTAASISTPDPRHSRSTLIQLAPSHTTGGGPTTSSRPSGPLAIIPRNAATVPEGSTRTTPSSTIASLAPNSATTAVVGNADRLRSTSSHRARIISEVSPPTPATAAWIRTPRRAPSSTSRAVQPRPVSSPYPATNESPMRHTGISVGSLTPSP